MKIVTSKSGAAFKISIHSGVAYEENTSYGNHEVLARFGISSGSIIEATTAIGDFNYMVNKSQNFKASSAFKQDPSSVLGFTMAVVRVLRGKRNLFDQTKLVDTLKEAITSKMFYEWKSSIDTCPVYVGCTNIENGELIYINLKDCTYDDCILAILASSSIPLYTSPVRFNDMWLYDGGLRSHIGSPQAAKMYGQKADVLVSSFSRPNDLKTVNWEMPKERFLKSPMLPLIQRVMEIQSWEVSKYDEFEADTICKEYNCSHIKIFAENKLTENLYKASKEEQRKWFLMGRKQFKKQWNMFNGKNG